MAITLVTGVPGTGKTAYIVKMILDAVATGRPVFVDGVKGLHNTTEFYSCGRIIDWQKGTWLHIDQYVRTDGSELLDADDDGSANWQGNPDVFYINKEGHLENVPKEYPLKEGQLKIIQHRDEHGKPTRVVDYESHKGAIVFIDEAQRYFRPRASGSVVPDHVAALEVHRHQGLDFVFISQRPALVDSNLRGLCGRHIALRNGWFGRYVYEWGEVGDIESKVSRDTAARSRYKLPKDVFTKYDSAAVHTVTKRQLPFAAKALVFILPLVGYFFWSSYSTVSGKFTPEPPRTASSSSHSFQPVAEAQATQHAGQFGVPASPSVLDAPPAAVYTPPKISSCIANATRCKCYTDKGVPIAMPEFECRASVREVNERFKLDAPNPHPTFGAQS